MNTFRSVFDNYDWETIKTKIYHTTSIEVESALDKKKRSLDDFLRLISPAAKPYLEQMAQLTHELTKKDLAKRFKCMLLCI